VLEVKIVHSEADQLGPAGARVEQQHDHGGVPAGLEVLAGAGREQPPQRVIGNDRDGLLRDGGRLHLRRRVGRDLAFVF
jgi:hypothetical protein